MINGKRIAVVMPAYNAGKTLKATVRELPDVVDARILVDDCSADHTVAEARELGLTVIVHDRNRGYGGNQKTCYAQALLMDADVIVMIHPDYQYSPRLVAALASMVAYGVYDIALGSRILGGEAIRGGMPVYKYLANRALTAFQNLMLSGSLSEYHTGFRAFSRELLLSLPIGQNSDDFLFDNQFLAQALLLGARIGEVSCPARYFPEASSINLRRSAVYGFGVVKVTLQYALGRWGFQSFSPFGCTAPGRVVPSLSSQARRTRQDQFVLASELPRQAGSPSHDTQQTGALPSLLTGPPEFKSSEN